MDALPREIADSLARAEARYYAAPADAPREPEPTDCDVDSFTDWLYGECYQSKPVPYPRHQRATVEDLKGRPARDLLALALDPGQPHGTRAAAMDALFVAFEPGPH